MPSRSRAYRPNRLPMIVVTVIGACVGLCLGAVVALGILQFLSR